MRQALRFCFAAIVAALLPAVTFSADPAERIKYPDDRVEFAQRSFGDVRFVMGAGQAMRWLEMYSGSNLIGAFRDFDAADVFASPDGKYFLAISNARSSALAFAVLDRNGQIVLSSPHDMGLRYCNQGDASSRYWINAARPQARFNMEKNPQSSGPDTLDVTVRGCDGADISLARFARVTEPATGPFARPNPSCNGVRMPAQKVETPVAGERGIVNVGEALRALAPENFGTTIANLRGLDPCFGGNTLVLIDGRRSTAPATAAGTRVPQPVDSQPAGQKSHTAEP